MRHFICATCHICDILYVRHFYMRHFYMRHFYMRHFYTRHIYMRHFYMRHFILVISYLRHLRNRTRDTSSHHICDTSHMRHITCWVTWHVRRIIRANVLGYIMYATHHLCDMTHSYVCHASRLECVTCATSQRSDTYVSSTSSYLNECQCDEFVLIFMLVRRVRT